MSDLRMTGCGRDANNTVSISFNRRPTEDEISFVRDVVERACYLMDPPEKKTPSLKVIDGDKQ